MLGRIILVIVAVALVLFLVRRALAASRPGQKETASEGQGDLVTCAHCGVNLPKSEARSAGGRHFCSEEHWRLGPRDR